MEPPKVKVDPVYDLLPLSDSEDKADNILPQKNVTNDSSGTYLYLYESYFNSTMGGCNVHVLFAMSVGILPHVAPIPRHKERLFGLSKIITEK